MKLASSLFLAGGVLATPFVSKLADNATSQYLSIGGIPKPETMIRVSGGALTVPPGFRFVITGVGATNGTLEVASVRFDGTSVLEVRLFDFGEPRSIVEVPPGLVAVAGTQVGGGSSEVVILGYWARIGEKPDLVVEGIPLPSQMVRLHDGEAYLVPTDSRLILTGVCSTGGAVTARVVLDGEEALEVPLDYKTGLVHRIPPGIVAGPGTMVEVQGNGVSAVLLGYLADA